MRVAMVTSHYSPTVGGIETHVESLSRELRSLGIAVDVFAPRIIGAAPGDGVVSYHAPLSRTGFPLPVGLHTALTRGTQPYDVVHAHNYHGLAAAVALLRTSRVTCFTPHYHGHGHSRIAELAHRPYRRVGKRLFAVATGVIAVSNGEADLIAHDFPVTAGKTVVIPNGVDVDEIRVASPFDKQGRIIVVAGRLEPHKRVERVIGAMAHLPDVYRLVVVGDGSARTHLEELVAGQRLHPRVDFVGRVPRSDVLRWFKTADVVASLSEAEAYGLVVAEGLTAGAQVLLSDIPPYRELANTASSSRSALVDTCDDAAAVAAHVQSLVGRRSARGQLSGVVSWSEVARRTVSFYSRLLELAS